ncbi:hypothetical protein ABT340_06845 [Streptosporangium sp. NPDC000239]|uniref:hypothetical protein n=1 Tax=Streptosporangium sp. NPDC000239 TaxID=3154248 RepID=UPI00331A4652
MDSEDLVRLGELIQAARKRREVDMADLREALRLLGEVTQATATVADHLRTEIAPLRKRCTARGDLLCDDTGEDAEPLLAEVRDRLRRIADHLEEAGLHARRSHIRLRRIDVQKRGVDEG